MAKFITIHVANAATTVAEKTVNVEDIVLIENPGRADGCGRILVRNAEWAAERGWQNREIDTTETYRQLKTAIRE